MKRLGKNFSFIHITKSFNIQLFNNNKSHFHQNVRKTNLFGKVHINISFSTQKQKYQIIPLFQSNFKKSFCTTNNKSSDNKDHDNASKSNKRYDYEYENPEDKEINLTTLGYKILFITFQISLSLLFIYLLIFKKYNEITKMREKYFINERYENWLAGRISNVIKQEFKHNIFKQEEDETIRVQQIFKNLCAKNKIFFPAYNAYVVEFPSIGALLLKNGDLFISSRTFQMAESDDEIAFLISHEIAHLVSDKSLHIILKIVKNRMLAETIFAKHIEKGNEIQGNNILTSNFLNLIDYNKYLSFYPDNVIFNPLEEFGFFPVTLRILDKAEYDLIKVT